MTAAKRRADPDSLAVVRQELCRLEARYRDLVERAGYGTFRASPEGRLTEANERFAAALGAASPDALRGVSLPSNVFLDANDWGRVATAACDGATDDWVDLRWRRID